jgi:hypothetical protein
MTDLSITHPGVNLEMTVEGLVADIFDIHEKTAYTFTGVFKQDDGTVIDPASWAIGFYLYDKKGGTELASWDTDSAITAATDLFTMTVASSDVAVDADALNGFYECVGYSGGTLGTNPTHRVQGQAFVREVDKE